ncbi:hypothetical protein KKE45_04130 [Patescibacteria group bacterium]|nr:hypothetical protein [Patescibacteria group bacterium]
MPKIKLPKKTTPNSAEELSTIAGNNPGKIIGLRQTGKIANNTNVPNVIEQSKKDTAGMTGKPDLNPPFKNSLNKADSMVKHIKDTSDEWTIASPFRLDEFADNPPYRGEGLLPTDKTDGVRVVHPGAQGGKD